MILGAKNSPYARFDNSRTCSELEGNWALNELNSQETVIEHSQATTLRSVTWII